MMQTGFHIIWLKMSPNSWFFLFSFLRADDRMEKTELFQRSACLKNRSKPGTRRLPAFFPDQALTLCISLRNIACGLSSKDSAQTEEFHAAYRSQRSNGHA